MAISVVGGWGRHSRGFTLLEMVISLAVGSLLVAGLVGLLLSLLNLPLRVNADYATQYDLRKAINWLTTDINASRTYETGSDPEYGAFEWFELSGSNPVAVEVKYLYDPTRKAMVRELRKDTVLTAQDDVARHIEAYGDISILFSPASWAYDDVTKTWVYTAGQASMTMSSQQWAGPIFSTWVLTGAFTMNTRVIADRAVPFPGIPPPVPPGLNRVDHRASATPTLLAGSAPSGTYDHLTFEDGRYYSVNSTTGGTRTVSWEVTGQDINYATIDAITLVFTSQTTDAGTLLELFIYNPTDPAHTDGGYDTAADVADTFAQANSNRTVTLSLGAEDLGYVSSLSPKKVRFKVKATLNKNHTLRTDQVLFRVNGEPAAGFQWDYLVDSDPTIVTGSYASGAYYDLTLDDTGYYAVTSTGTPQTAAADMATQRIYLSTVSAASVTFTGRASRSNTTVELFIYNPANGGDGYSATPDITATYASSNTDYTATFSLKAADVTYVNGLTLKEVKMRVKATNSGGSFTFSMDRVYFRVTK